MWKTSNKLNEQTLDKYTQLIINLFNLIITLSKRPNKLIEIESEEFLNEQFDQTPILDKRLLKINRSSEDKFTPLIKNLIKLEPNLLENQYKIYELQNNLINNLNFNLIQEQHPTPLKKLFKDYLYDKFFGVNWIWSELIGEDFSREQFKNNFKKENKLYVCSYCDTETISNTRNAWIEHFLPKNKFPFLSCNPRNLIPSCTSCNVSGSGKGEDVKNPIHNQYNIQIGDNLEFGLNNNKITITSDGSPETENFLSLLKLQKRYEEEAIKESILSLLKINYDIASLAKNMGEFDEKIYFDFIQSTGKIRGFYFVQRDLLKHIDEI